MSEPASRGRSGQATGRHHRGVGVHRRRAAAAAAPATPTFEVVVATGDTQAGTRVADLYPSLAGAYPRPACSTPTDPDWPSTASTSCSAACPTARRQALVPELRRPGRPRRRPGRRLPAGGRRRSTRRGTARSTPCPELLAEFVYGLPELFRASCVGAEPVAAPGCYLDRRRARPGPAACGPGCVEPTGIVVDAASGVSGAGRPPKPNTTFCTVDEDFTAYGLLDHRHTPEIEQAYRVAGSRCRCSSPRTWRR